MARAKAQGKSIGRSRAKFDQQTLSDLVVSVQDGTISRNKAADALGVSGRTFSRYMANILREESE